MTGGLFTGYELGGFYGEAQGIERTRPMDLFPRIIADDEGAGLEKGLAQRIDAVNRFLESSG